jgi:hypothetical protein
MLTVTYSSSILDDERTSEAAAALRRHGGGGNKQQEIYLELSWVVAWIVPLVTQGGTQEKGAKTPTTFFCPDFSHRGTNTRRRDAR